MAGLDLKDCRVNVMLSQLQQLLRNEKSAPEVLPFGGALVHKVQAAVNEQEQQLEQPQRDTDDRLYFNIHKMELERVKYLLKSYLRTRLFKIERNLLFLVEKDLAHLLSEAEIEFAWTLTESRKALFNMGLFNKIPSSLNHFQKDAVDERLSKKRILKLCSYEAQ